VRIVLDECVNPRVERLLETDHALFTVPKLGWGGLPDNILVEHLQGRCEVFLTIDHMSRTISVRLTPELTEWLQETSRRTGLPAGRIIRQQLERARSEAGNQRFLRHAGKISGPQDLSSRKGFAPHPDERTVSPAHRDYRRRGSSPCLSPEQP